MQPHTLPLAAVGIITAMLTGLVACTSPQPTEPTEQTTEQRQQDRPPASVAADLGRVEIDASCTLNARSRIEIGTAQLHHMWYTKARESFQKAAAADEDCAMAQWGLAMTYYTPLWAKPYPEDLEAGARAAQKAADLGGETPREKAYIDAVAAFYDDYENRSHEERAKAFEEAWKQAYEQDPQDVEAASFYALAMLSTIPPTAEDVDTQRQAGAILEDVLDQEPNHPGGHHYLIHAYDNPQLASEAVEVSRDYSELAPAVPHALHMPSHTFTRLGMWDESIEWNQRSEEAARRNPVAGMDYLDLYHAQDYLTYAYLQEARDTEAEKVAQRAKEAQNPQPHTASAYASIAIPARLALERRDWQAAANLEPLHPETIEWEKWPYIEGIKHAARAVGLIELDELDQARVELDKMAELQQASAEMNEPYWNGQLQIYQNVVRALLADAEGNTAEALAGLRDAATSQEALGKHPVTPGRVIQASEVLGETLRENGQAEEALEVYVEALDKRPNRFRAVYGAAVSARAAGQGDVARDYYNQLLDLTAKSDGDRPELKEAREFTAVGGGASSSAD
ncbi:hypothetical protein FIV42_04610 [Persicimonas caeni]|uniref:Tetratricopeptide repeat protein n=1 Tax=Persicimonas caeni TaxID=2292766 RepID=A0A4Y6PP07_PERCE|nr:hypothetical protein [Persicimonas caeni]QDG50044.1 hypothetical protein FIV42_04610 [Persicimonas caeni]QED31265.1 hypothetical protein FRD00_04605 [Persicimonas caeni]